MIKTFTEKDIKRKKRCIELVKQQFENNIFSGFFLLDENLNIIDNYGSSLKFKLSYSAYYAYNKKCNNNVKEKLIKMINETIEDLNNGTYITKWENDEEISEQGPITIQVLLIPQN